LQFNRAGGSVFQIQCVGRAVSATSILCSTQ